MCRTVRSTPKSSSTANAKALLLLQLTWSSDVTVGVGGVVGGVGVVVVGVGEKVKSGGGVELLICRMMRCIS